MKILKSLMPVLLVAAFCALAATAYNTVPLAPEEQHPNFEEIPAPDGCLACHGESGVKPTPHADRHSCKQCHIPGVAGDEGGEQAAGLPANRAFPGAPPMAPAGVHPTFEDLKTPDGCLACHNEKGVIPTSHPERHSCKQCHIPFVPAEGASAEAGAGGMPPFAPAENHPGFENFEAPGSCLMCHGESSVKPTAHPGRPACKQCHLSQ